jgi:hypothetical protein
MRYRSRLAVVIAIVSVGAAGCGQRQEVEEYKATWIRLSHIPVEEAMAGAPVRIQAEVEVSEDVEDVELLIHCETETSTCGPIKMALLEPGVYFASIPPMDRGTLVEYYIQASAGDVLQVKVPGGGAETFKFYCKGVPNRAVLIVHVALMVVALFIFIMCGYLALKAIRDRKIRLQIPRLGFLGGVAFFISTIPLGMIVEYQTYGRPWSGFPIGDSFTDNRSLAILLYFAAATFLYRGSVFRRDPSRDLIKQVSTSPYVYFIGAAMTVVLYLIPH